MTLPPYIPGAVLAASTVATLAIGVVDIVDPKVAENWTDRGLILALLATSFGTCGILLRMLLKDREKREKDHIELLKSSITVHQAVLEYLEDEKKFRDGIANQAIQHQLDDGRKERTTRVLLKYPDPPQ